MISAGAHILPFMCIVLSVGKTEEREMDTEIQRLRRLVIENLLALTCPCLDHTRTPSESSLDGHLVGQPPTPSPQAKFDIILLLPNLSPNDRLLLGFPIR